MLRAAAMADHVVEPEHLGPLAAPSSVQVARQGTIENLHVVSGPAMLQQAAMDAVRTWRYRPYLLDGQPTEVETTVNVIFSLQ